MARSVRRADERGEGGGNTKKWRANNLLPSYVSTQASPPLFASEHNQLSTSTESRAREHGKQQQRWELSRRPLAAEAQTKYRRPAAELAQIDRWLASRREQAWTKLCCPIRIKVAWVRWCRDGGYRNPEKQNSGAVFPIDKNRSRIPRRRGKGPRKHPFICIQIWLHGNAFASVAGYSGLAMLADRHRRHIVANTQQSAVWTLKRKQSTRLRSDPVLFRI